MDTPDADLQAAFNLYAVDGKPSSIEILYAKEKKGWVAFATQRNIVAANLIPSRLKDTFHLVDYPDLPDTSVLVYDRDHISSVSGRALGARRAPGSGMTSPLKPYVPAARPLKRARDE